MTLRAPRQGSVGWKRDRESSSSPAEGSQDDDNDLARAIAASLENQSGKRCKKGKCIL